MTHWSIDRCRSYLKMTAQRVPDVAACIAWKRGQDCWSGTVGYGHTELPANSRFSIWSITKTLTAALILRLVARGRIELDSPLAAWLPEVPHADLISIRQCLQHTSGWSDYGVLPEYQAAVRRGETPWSFSEFMDRVHAANLLFAPGSGWSYSNIGYMVLKKLAETACEKTFADILKAEVCDPLGLVDTSVTQTREDMLGLTVGYSLDLSSDGQPVDVRPRYDPGWAPPGFAASTASEVVRFYNGLFAGELLPAPLLGEMCRVKPIGHAHPSFVTPSYGLGLMADPDNRVGLLYGHNGAGPGYAASAFHIRPRGARPVTVAVLTNAENWQEVEALALTVGEELATFG
ncbi:MAG: beta-lactamase family protein [Nitrospira sp.]